MTRVAAVYVRISQDKSGRAEGVAAQERWGREYAAKMWPDTPVKVFADNDLSAADPKVTRPEFERLRQWVRDGRIGHIWCVEQYRLIRQEREWFELTAELDAADITSIHTERDGVIRVGDEIGAIKAVLGNAEVRRAKERLNKTLGDKAGRGEPSGGLRFGYRRAITDDGKKTFAVEPNEAAIIRMVADKILAGWSISGIVADLDKQNIRGRRGGQIKIPQISNWLRSPSICGHRVYRGEIVKRDCWEPILDEATWHAVNAKLSQPRRIKRADGNGEQAITERFFGRSTGRKYLITGGIGMCGVCGAALIGRPVRLGRTEPLPYLVCPGKNLGGNSCVGISMAKAERYVLDTLFAELDKPAFLNAIGADDNEQQRKDITTQLSVLDKRRDEMAAERATGELTKSEWFAAKQALEKQGKELRAVLAGIPQPMGNIDIHGARESWPHMTLDERREFIRLFIDRVVLHRSPTRSRWVDVADRVEIDWRTR